MMTERAAEDASDDTSKLATSSHKNGKSTEGGLDNAAYEGDDRTAMNDIPPIVDNKNGLELVNMNVTSGKTNGSDFTHYYMPVNTHKKLLRGEKLYVTRDPRTRGVSRRKVLICAIVWFLIVVVFVLAVLAAMGILFTSSATSESTSNQSTYLTLGTDVPTVVNEDDSTFNGISSPQTMQLKFKITNLLFDNHLLDENSLHFKSLQNRLKNELYHVFLPLRVWKVVVNKFSKGSVIVHSLLYWSPDQPDLITESELSDTFIDALQETNAFLGPYSVEISSISISEVTELPDAKETRPSEFGRGMSGDWSTGTQTSTTDLWSILAGWTTEKSTTTREEEQTAYSSTVHFHQHATETESTAFEHDSTLSANNASGTSDMETTTTERSTTTSTEESTEDYVICAGTQACIRNDTYPTYSATEIEPSTNETTESSVSTTNATTQFIIPPFITMEDMTTTTMPEANSSTDFVFPTIEDIRNATLNETDHEESTLPVGTTLSDNATIDFMYTALFNNETSANETTETSVLFNFTEFYDNASISTDFSTFNLTEAEMTLNESTTENNETFEGSSTVSDVNKTENRTTEVEEIDQTSTFSQYDNTSVFANNITEISEVTVNISALESMFTTEAPTEINVTTQTSSADTSESTFATQNVSSTESELTEVTTVNINPTNIATDMNNTQEDVTTSPPSSDEVDYANKNTIEEELVTKINKSTTESTTLEEMIKTTQISSGEVDYANKSSEETEATTMLHENEVTEAATMQSATETATQTTIMPNNATVVVEGTTMRYTETATQTTIMPNNATIMETTTMHNNETVPETTMMHNNETIAEMIETTTMHNNETVTEATMMHNTETTMMHNTETIAEMTETTTMHNTETTMMHDNETTMMHNDKTTKITETTMMHKNEATTKITETTIMHNNETAAEITETTMSDISSSIENETNEETTTSSSVFEAEEGAGEVTYSSNENSRRR